MKRRKHSFIARTPALAMGLALVCLLSSCRTPYFKTVKFNTIEELKSEIGTHMVYPGALPEGFVYDSDRFYGNYFKDSDTWEYQISYSNSYLSAENDKNRQTLPPGTIEIYSVGFSCYEPEHETPKWDARYDSRVEIGEFEHDVGAFELLDIEGEKVTYWCYNGKTSTGLAPYLFLGTSTKFMSGGILYEISISIYANGEYDFDTFLAFGKEQAEFTARSMLGLT